MGRRASSGPALVVAVAVLLSSCTTMQETYQENPKAVLGAALGTAAGAGIAAAA